MSTYYDSLNVEKKAYFKILSPEFPQWLWKYINTKEMERIGKISLSCGTDYSKCYNIKYWYSNLDHSVGVALIIWNFTHDNKQTLAGLFHDIATPVFKHCIDFMNGDSENQEYTEERTTSIIQNSKEIMKYLKEDNIKLEEVNDYKKYPIADNDTPRLSADRFEYNFSSGLTFFRIWELDKIREVYNNIIVVKNEDNLDELAFKDKEICEKYIHNVSKLWPCWVEDKDRLVMQFLADICKSMNIFGYLTTDDLYNMSEKDVINKILNCDDKYLSDIFKKFQNTDKYFSTNYYDESRYCIKVKSKARYLVPLVKTKEGPIRINKISEQSNKEIKEYLRLDKGDNYVSFDFEFTPYQKEVHKKIVKKK